MSAKRTPSIIEVAVSNLGVVRGANVALDVFLWALTMQRPEWADARTIEDKVDLFADVSHRSRRQGHRRLVAARQAFPGHEPWEVAASVVRVLEVESIAKDEVGLLPYPFGVA